MRAIKGLLKSWIDNCALSATTSYSSNRRHTGTQLVELRDVRAAYKGLVARTGQYDRTYIDVVFEGLQRLGNTRPHVEGNGVVLGRIVKRDPAGVAFALDHQVVGNFALE